jgi:hypothetical protein
MEGYSGRPSRAQISRASIQRLYIAMRHLFIRGSYKPLGVSGEAMINAMLSLKPEIYGSIADEEKVELTGLLYIFQRLPQGIEQCRYVKLISREGFEDTHFEPIIPSKRRRNCYRIDEEQMFIEMTRGRSDIYDVLTHLTFMYIESEKIRKNSLDSKGRKNRSWLQLEKIIEKLYKGEDFNKEVGYTYLSTILGRTYEETARACHSFTESPKVNDIFEITYWLGKLSMDEFLDGIDREITFSSSLREKLGHHVYGEQWSDNIKAFIYEKGWQKRPVHVISSNLHSVMNSLYAKAALHEKVHYHDLEELAEILSQEKNGPLREEVRKYALKNGMYEIDDHSGTNISVQIFDCENIDPHYLPKEIDWVKSPDKLCPLILVMDYAFGEQAYETMDELLKPYEFNGTRMPFNVLSVNIMGKAGILKGHKGDIMIPTAHVFEGSADNYPINNLLQPDQFKDDEIAVYKGPMITVLGTSLQNKDILRYFMNSSWQVIGLEMEGAHYQKAIQAASKIRRSINEDIEVRYAYYASDNPLETGSTLASGSLGLDGVKPTYLITFEILKGIFS